MHHQAVDGTAAVYRLLFERNPHAVVVVDYETLRLLRANDAAATQYGYPLAELLDLPLEALWPGAREALARRRAGQPPGEPGRAWRHVRKSGEALEVQLSFQDLVFAGRPAVALHVGELTLHDFSVALLEAQNRLLELVARGGALPLILEALVLAMERLSSGMLGSVLLLDDDGRHARHGAAPNLPAPYWRAVEGMKIGPEAGSCGTAMHLGRQVVVPDIAVDPLWGEFRELALAHGLRACWSTPIRSRAGKILGAFAMYYRQPRRPDERDVRLVEAAIDLAAVAIERERSERALQERESRLRAILDHAFAVVWVKDMDGRYTMVNRRFEEATGFSSAVALGRTDRQLFGQALAEAYGASEREALQTLRPVESEDELPHPDGAHLYLSVKFPLVRPDGSAYALCCIASDISERKRAERGLERSREELRALAARLHSVREEERLRISRDIHDHLGQMLTVLQMSLSLLTGSVRGAGGLDREATAAQLQSMQDLVASLLSAVRRIVTELRPEVLDTLGLAAALEWQAAEFGRRTGIECSVALPGGAVQADAERATVLFRIFQEALSNVARHSGARRVQVELRRDGAFLEMRVTDDGRGITQAEARASASLGLLGMRERAAMLGGSTVISGEAGKGTTVTVRLPAA